MKLRLAERHDWMTCSFWSRLRVIQTEQLQRLPLPEIHSVDTFGTFQRLLLGCLFWRQNWDRCENADGSKPPDRSIWWVSETSWQSTRATVCHWPSKLLHKGLLPSLTSLHWLGKWRHRTSWLRTQQNGMTIFRTRNLKQQRQQWRSWIILQREP